MGYWPAPLLQQKYSPPQIGNPSSPNIFQPPSPQIFYSPSDWEQKTWQANAQASHPTQLLINIKKVKSEEIQ